MKILRTTTGERFAVLDDAPELLVPVEEPWFEELMSEGVSEDNALELAIASPYRVTWGFGVFENYATIEAAITACDEQAEAWGDEILAPEVLHRIDDKDAYGEDPMMPFEVIHRPRFGGYVRCDIESREPMPV